LRCRFSRTPGGRPRTCKCKHTQCLKLYCECFANGHYCDPGCSCQDCLNRAATEDRRTAAIRAVLERNANAFRPKVAADVADPTDSPITKHAKGCNCRKSYCLKKYCECFQAGIECSSRCGCIDCKNVSGNVEREQIMQYGDGHGTDSAPSSPTKRARLDAAAAGRAGVASPLTGSGSFPAAFATAPGVFPGAGSVPSSPTKRMVTAAVPLAAAHAGGRAGAASPLPSAAGARAARRDPSEPEERQLYASMLRHEKLLRFSEVLVVAAQEAERAVLQGRGSPSRPRSPPAASIGAPAGAVTPGGPAAALLCDERDVLVSPTLEVRPRRHKQDIGDGSLTLRSSQCSSE